MYFSSGSTSKLCLSVLSVQWKLNPSLLLLPFIFKKSRKQKEELNQSINQPINQPVTFYLHSTFQNAIQSALSFDGQIDVLEVKQDKGVKGEQHTLSIYHKEKAQLKIMEHQYQNRSKIHEVLQ